MEETTVETTKSKKLDSTKDTATEEESQDNQERPELPSSFDGEMPEMPMDGEMPEMPTEGFSGGMGRPEMSQTAPVATSSIHPAVYLSIGAGSVIFSMAVFWAILSKFFKLGLADTLKGTKKVLIFIIGSLVLTAGICIGGYFIAENISGKKADTFSSSTSETRTKRTKSSEKTTEETEPTTSETDNSEEKSEN